MMGIAFFNKDKDKNKKNKPTYRTLAQSSPQRGFASQDSQAEITEVKKIFTNIISLVLIGLAAFLFLSLASFDEDVCITNYGFFESSSYLTGSYGKCIAGFFFNLIGGTAYFFCFMLGFLGYWVVKNKEKRTETTLSSVFIVVLGVVFIVFFIAPAIWDLWTLHLKAPSNMGKIVLDMLLNQTGPIGTNFILIFAFIMCLTLIFKISWVEMMQVIGRTIVYLFRLSQSKTSFFSGSFFSQLKIKKPSIALLGKNKNPANESAVKSGLNIKNINLNPKPIENQSNSLNMKSAIQFTEPKTEVKKPTIMPIAIEDENDEGQPHSYIQPKVDLLKDFSFDGNQYSHQQLMDLGSLIEKKLADFKIGVKVVDIHPGPVITRFELDLDNGVKVSQVSNLSKDLARSLSLPSVRIVEVIPGKPHIGIEIPNQSREMVSLREIIESGVFNNAGSALTIALGKDISGKTRIVDLATMPHLLVAGTTGSGKSVAINAMILSMLYKASPDDVKLILIDPKMIELSVYEDIPHLITPVVTQMEKAFSALQWCVYEMNRRYKVMTEYKFTHITEFNKAIAQKKKKGEQYLDEDGKPMEKMPFIVVFIDEFADLILVEGKKIENLVARLAGKARAAGIHLVVATQRPSVNVITGVIKANIPARIAFQLPTKVDSRTILEQGGAEQLLGKGDMLYLAGGAGVPERIHGAFVSRDEVKEVVEYWKEQAKAHYLDGVTTFTENTEAEVSEPVNPVAKSDDEDIYQQAVELVIKDRRASISYVQRKLQIGYNRSANLIEKMEADGIVSAPAQNGNRNVLVNTPPVFGEDRTDNKE